MCHMRRRLLRMCANDSLAALLYAAMRRRIHVC